MKKLLFILLVCLPFCAKAELYGVFIGVSKYTDARLDARYLDDEARQMRNLFFRSDNPNSMLITNERATKSNILAALKVQIAKATTNDRIIIFYAGRTNNGNISAYDEINGISYDEIRKMLAKSEAMSKILLINNCNIDADEFQNENKAEKLFKNDDIFLLQSSRPDEKSRGNADLESSYFTYFLIEGIKGMADLNGDGKINPTELYAYVNIKVSEKTSGMQHPVTIGTMNKDIINVPE